MDGGAFFAVRFSYLNSVGAAALGFFMLSVEKIGDGIAPPELDALIVGIHE